MLFKKKKKDSTNIESEFTRNVTTLNDLFSPDSVIEGHTDIQLGVTLCRVYTILSMPRRISVGWFDEILALGGVAISTRFVPAKDSHASKVLQKQLSKVETELIQEQNAGRSININRLRAERDDYDEFHSAVQLGTDRLLYWTLLIKVHTKTPEELRIKCETLEGICARKNIGITVLTLRQTEGLKHILPLNPRGLEDVAKNFTTEAAMTCVPITTASGGHPSGAMLGVNCYTGSPVFLNRFGGERLVSNPHIFISGMSGSGKSVTVRQLALLEAYTGVRAAFVDVEGEYADFVEAIGGKVITLSPGVFSGINPLDLEVETNDQGETFINITDKVEDFSGLVSTVFEFYNGKGLALVDAALLEDAILGEYAHRGITTRPETLYDQGIKKPMPTISDIQSRLSDMENGQTLADSIKPLLRGGVVGMFDGQTEIKLGEVKQICFNLKPLGGEFSRFVGIYATLSWLWQNFATIGGKAEPKSIAIDEAWMFLKYRAAASYLETLARRGRKHGCGLIIATQRFEEFSSSKEGRAIIESCATIMVLKQESQAASAAVEYFHLPHHCVDEMARFNPGQAILRVSGDTLEIQVSLAPFELQLVETKIRG